MCSLVNRPNANERLVCPRAHERCPAHGAQLVPSAPQAREKPVVRHQAMNDLSSPPFFEKIYYENVQNSSCHALFLCSGTEQYQHFLVHGVLSWTAPFPSPKKMLSAK